MTSRTWLSNWFAKSVERKAAPRPALAVTSLEDRTVPTALVTGPVTDLTSAGVFKASYNTIQEAINASSNNDIIEIAANTTSTESVNFNKVTTLRGAGNTALSGVTVVGDVTFGNSNFSTSVKGNLQVNGNVALKGSGQLQTADYSTPSSVGFTGNLTSTSTNYAGAVVLKLDGSGDQTVQGSSGANPAYAFSDIEVNKPGGTAHFVGNIALNEWNGQNGTPYALNVVAGAVDALGSSITVTTAQYRPQKISAAGVTFGNLTVNASPTSATITAETSLAVAGYFTQLSGVFFAPASTLTVGGDFTATSLFNANGGLVRFNGANKTISATGATLNNVDFAINQYAGLTVSGSFAVAKDVTINGGVYTSLTGGTIAVKGNVTSNNTTFQGDTTFQFTGTGAQTLSGPGRVTGVSIAKPSGTLAIIGSVGVTGDWTYTSGTVATTDSTVHFEGANKTIDGSGVTFDNVVIAPGQYTGLTVDEAPLKVTGALTLAGGRYAALSGGTIEASGDVTVANPEFQGAGVVKFVGTGNQALASADATVPGRLTFVEIAKTGGTLTVAGTVAVTGDWTYTSGGVNAAGGTVRFDTNQYTTRTVSAGGMVFGNLVLNGGTWSSLKVIGAELTVVGNVSLSGYDYAGLDATGGDIVLHVDPSKQVFDSNPTYRNKTKIRMVVTGTGANDTYAGYVGSDVLNLVLSPTQLGSLGTAGIAALNAFVSDPTNLTKATALNPYLSAAGAGQVTANPASVFETVNVLVAVDGSLLDLTAPLAGITNVIVAGSTQTTINGTSGNDLIIGNALDNNIDGKSGNDIVFGMAGNDIVTGGDGNDWVFGGDGNDTVTGGAGNDTVKGGSGADILLGDSILGATSSNYQGNTGKDVFIIDSDWDSTGDVIADFRTTNYTGGQYVAWDQLDVSLLGATAVSNQTAQDTSIAKPTNYMGGYGETTVTITAPVSKVVKLRSGYTSAQGVFPPNGNTFAEGNVIGLQQPV